jgi:hypothetical protein
VFIIPSSWGSQLVAKTTHQQALSWRRCRGTKKNKLPRQLGAVNNFLAPLPGRKRISARRVSHFQSFYFVIVLLSFFTLFLFASFYKNTKKN